MQSNIVLKKESVEWKTQEPGGSFKSRMKDLTSGADLEELGFRFYEVEPGHTSWPFHAHNGNEEVILPRVYH